jgi:DNA primase RepB-like protein
MADFFFCMVAAQRGHGTQAIANKLLEISPRAQERARLYDEGYALITAQNATAAAERGRKRGRASNRCQGHKLAHIDDKEG